MSTIPPRLPAVPQDMFNYVMCRGGDQQLHCVVSFGGRVDAKTMARATRLLLDLEPVLGCRFVERFWRPHWQRREDLDEIELFRLVETAAVENALLDFVLQPTDPSRDPLVQVRLFRSTTDTLCLKTTHVVTDAGGTKELAYLLASIYRTLKRTPGYKAEPNLARRDQTDVLEKFGRVEKWKAFVKTNIPRPVLTVPAFAGGDSDRTFAVERIETEQYRAIDRYCQRRHVTVNDVLLAAFYQALLAMSHTPPTEPVPVIITADLRRYLSQSSSRRPIRSLSVAVFPAISCQREMGLDGMVDTVHRKMKTLKENNLGLNGSVALRLICLQPFAMLNRLIGGPLEKSLQENGEPTPITPTFSNFGRIEADRLVFGDVEVKDAHLFSPLLFAPGFFMGASTFQESMALTVGFCKVGIKRQDVEQFLRLVKSNLPA